MPIAKQITVYTSNSFFAGKKINISYEEQIAIIANDLLETNADVNILPEFSSGLIRSGHFESIPDRIAEPIHHAVTDAISWGLGWLPFGIGNAIGSFAGSVVGAAVKLPLTVVTTAVTKIASIEPLGTFMDTALEVTAGKVLPFLTKEIGGVPTENLFGGDHGRLKDIVDYMNAKAGDGTYKYVIHGSTATISKYEMLDAKSNGSAVGGSNFIIDFDKNGAVSSLDINFDTTHANESKYAAYLPRGASSDGPTPGKVTTDKDIIKAVNLASGRTEAISSIINSHENGPYKNLPHLISGDFNEPSHLDWLLSNKFLFDRNGVDYMWDTSKELEKRGYIDSFREKFPDPIKNPGNTWGGPVAGAENKSWTTKDDRERIDYNYYKDGSHLDLTVSKSSVIGSNDYFIKGVATKVTSDDSLTPKNYTSWYSDHKGVLTTYDVSTIGQPLVEAA